MACIDYMKASGETEASLKSQLPKDSFNCLTQYNDGLCKAFCTNPTKNYQGCMNCLSNKSLCRVTPNGESGSKNSKPCCPHIAEAFRCLDCLAENVTDTDKCTKESHERTYIIAGAVGGFILLLIIGIVVYFEWRKHRQNAAVTQDAALQNLSASQTQALQEKAHEIGASDVELQSILESHNSI